MDPASGLSREAEGKALAERVLFFSDLPVGMHEGVLLKDA